MKKVSPMFRLHENLISIKEMDKKCSTDQRFIFKEITSLKIHTLITIYSGVHKSPPPFFSKILEKPSIVQKKNDTSYKEWTGKTIYLNFSSIFGDFFLKFFEEEVSDYLS